jgi:hypothetical protein
MMFETGQVHVARVGGSVQAGKHVAHRRSVIGPDPALVATLEKPLEHPAPEAQDHSTKL